MSSAQTSTLHRHSLFGEILRSSSLYSLAFFAPTVAGMLLLPVTTRGLTRADYAITDLLTQVSSVLTILLGMNFSAALGYFYFAAQPGEPRRLVVGTSILGSAALGAAAWIFCWPFTSVMSRLVFPGVDAGPYLHMVFFFMLPGFALEALSSWLRVENRATMLVAVSLFRVAATIVGTVALVGLLRMRVWGVINTTVASAVLTLLVLLFFWLRTMGWPAFDGRLFLRMLRFALPLGLGMMAMFVLNFGDRFILPHYRPLADLGLYTLAYKIGMLLSAVYGSFHVYWSAQMFQIMKREDAETVFPRVFTYVILSISFCALALIVCARPTLRILAAPTYQGAAPLVPLIVVAYYFRSVGEFVRGLFLVAGRPGCDAICNWMGAAICLAGYLLLIPRYGIWGAAIATALAFAAIGAVSVLWSYRVAPYRVEPRRLVKIGIAMAVAITPYCLLRATSLPAQFGSAVLSLALFALVLWLSRFPTPVELKAGRAALGKLFQAGRKRGGMLR